jgi:N6-L-threonylcarbamoyladenine synthase
VLESYASEPRLPPHDTEPLPLLPIPLSSGGKARHLAFSFSGLLSATERLVVRLRETEERTGPGEGKVEENEGIQREVARAFQEAAVGHVVQKVRLAMEGSGLDELGGLVVSGGVACNLVLRQRCVSAHE